MNELQIFSNSKFGEMRTTEIDGATWFCLADICRPLEIKSKDCKKRLKPDGVVTINLTDSIGRPAQMLFVNESNFYKAVFQSKKQEAEEFTEWVTSEVLPSLRKHGTYTMQPMTPAQLQLAQAQLLVDMDKKLARLENKSSQMENKVNLLSSSPEYWRLEMDDKIKRLADTNGIFANVLRSRLYDELEQSQSSLDLNNRLTRMKNRARKQGALERSCAKLTRLDVIAQNKGLRTQFEIIMSSYDTQLVIELNH